MHLMKDKVHNIKSEVRFLITILSTVKGEVHKIYKSPSDSIIIPATWSNGGPEKAKQLTIDRQKPSGSTNCSRLVIKIK